RPFEARRPRVSSRLGVVAFSLAAAFPPMGYSAMTIIHATPFDLRDARVEGPKPVPFEKGLFRGAGSIESSAIETAEAFDNLVGSFNADVPKGAVVGLEVQARIGETWTSWYRLVEWAGNGGGRSLEEQKDGDGKVDVDTLSLNRPAMA